MVDTHRHGFGKFRFQIRIASLLLALGVAHGEAQASTAASINDTDPQTLVARMDVIFTGKAIATELIWQIWSTPAQGVPYLRTRFEIETGWKGVRGKVLSVDAYESFVYIPCASSIQVGGTYTVFARGSPARGFRTSPCSVISAGNEERFLPALEAYRAKVAAFDAAGTNADAVRVKARFLSENHDWPRALEAFEQLLAQRPGDEEGIAGRGRALAALDRHEDALADFEHMLALDPGDTEARRNRIIALFKLGRTHDIDRQTSALAKGEFAGISLVDKDLSGLDLEGAWISNVDLSSADLRGANLRFATLATGTTLAGAQLQEANLQNAYAYRLDFTQTGLRGADFSHAQLQGADFTGVDLSGVDLSANLSQATLRRTNLQRTVLLGAVLTGADLGNADLRGATLSGARLHQADLSGADFSGAALENMQAYFARYDCNTIWPPDFDPAAAKAIPIERTCRGRAMPLPSFAGMKRQYSINLVDLDLSGMSFADVEMLAPDFRGSNLRNADFAAAKLRLAKFGPDESGHPTDLGGADLTGATLEGADLRGANLVDARLAGTTFLLSVYDCRTRWPAGFDVGATSALPAERRCEDRLLPPPHLAGAQLSDIHLPALDLSGAILAGADLFRADLRGMNLTNADLASARLSQAKLGPDDRGQPANLSGANLANGDLAWVNLVAAILEGADLTKVKLDEADLGNGRLARALLAGASLKTADLSGADLSNVDLTGADLTEADLRGADLATAGLQKSVLERALYDCRTKWPAGFDAGASGAISSERHCDAVPMPPTPNLAYKSIRGRFARMLAPVDLSGANFSKAYLLYASFRGARLRGANLSRAQIRGVDFGPDQQGRPTDLRNANLAGAEIGEVILRGADLTDADLRGAYLGHAAFDARSGTTSREPISPAPICAVLDLPMSISPMPNFAAPCMTARPSSLPASIPRPTACGVSIEPRRTRLERATAVRSRFDAAGSSPPFPVPAGVEERRPHGPRRPNDVACAPRPRSRRASVRSARAGPAAARGRRTGGRRRPSGPASGSRTSP
jgi:uncharacterized protein YjbI with pentapeptide repeats